MSGKVKCAIIGSGNICLLYTSFSAPWRFTARSISESIAFYGAHCCLGWVYTGGRCIAVGVFTHQIPSGYGHFVDLHVSLEHGRCPRSGAGIIIFSSADEMGYSKGNS